MQVVCILVRDKEVIFDFVEACFRFGARLAWTEEAVFLEFPNPKSNKSLERLFVELENLATHFDVQTRIAVAEDAPTALCYAQYGFSNRDLLPIESLRYFASPFRAPMEVEHMIRFFRHQGCATLKELRAFLPHTIGHSFGKQALDTFVRSKGKAGTSWPGFQFLENYAALANDMALPVLESAS